MNLLLLAPLAITLQGSGDAAELKSRIVEASVFKSGLVMLTREVTVPAGDGKYTLDVVPEALDGSFWYNTSDGTLISDVETTLRIKDKTIKTAAQSLADYLEANIGQRVKLFYRVTTYTQPPTTKMESIEGIVNGTPRTAYNMVPIKMDNGHLRNLALQDIQEIDTNGIKSEITRKVKTPELKIVFRAQAKTASKMHFVTMEGGAAWVGSYLVKLQKGGASSIDGKAQLALAGLSFDETNVRALAGEPNLMQNGKFDLNSGVGTLTSYLDSSQSQFLRYHPSTEDPYAALPIYFNQANQAQAELDSAVGNYNGSPYGGFGGGMGGGGGRGGGPGMDSMVFNNPIDGSLVVKKDPAQQASTDRLESIFAYPIGKVSLQPGDRLSRLLFSQSSTYENLFRWQATVGNNDTTVKSILRIHNNGTVPWTGGSVLITKDDAPLAQMEMPFTPQGKDADLEQANTKDILTKKDEVEVSRDTIPMPQRPKFTLPRSLNEVRLSVESARTEPVKFELTLLVPGDVVEAGGGKTEKLLMRTDEWNGQTRVTWSFNLSPGDKREFKLQYRHIG